MNEQLFWEAQWLIGEFEQYHADCNAMLYHEIDTWDFLLRLER